MVLLQSAGGMPAMMLGKALERMVARRSSSWCFQARRGSFSKPFAFGTDNHINMTSDIKRAGWHTQI